MKRSVSFLLLNFLIIQSAQAQRWSYFGVFPQYSQTESVTKRLTYNGFVSSTLNPFRPTLEKKFPRKLIYSSIYSQVCITN